MAKFKFQATINPDGLFSAKVKGAITDNDLLKPVKLSIDTTDTYELCADGDGIDAFITAIDPATADGLHFCTLSGGRSGDRQRCEASGSMTVGDLVEAGAVAAAGTAETNALPLVSTHAVSALGDILNINWRVISANTSDGSVTSGDTTVIIERL